MQTRIYQDCLSTLQQVPGITGSIILRKNGDRICHTFGNSELLDKIMRLTRDHLKLIQLLQREGRTGHCQNVTLKGSFGILELYLLNSHNLVTGILGSESMNIGLLRATLNEEFGKIEELEGI